MSPHLLGAIVIGIWLAPAAVTAYLIWREVTAKEDRPDPVFGPFDDEVESLERIWRAS